MARQGIDFLESGHVDQDAAGDDRRDRRRVALARAPVAPPVPLLEAVVPVEVQAGRDVSQTVDLGRHVVRDEERRRVPVDMVGVLVRRRCVGVVHPVHAIGAAERDDLARAVPGPFKAAAAVRQTQVEDLTLFRERQRRRARRIRKRVQRSHLVVLTPDPAPSLALLPSTRWVSLSGECGWADVESSAGPARRRPGLLTAMAPRGGQADAGDDPGTQDRQSSPRTSRVHLVSPAMSRVPSARHQNLWARAFYVSTAGRCNPPPAA